MSNVLQYRVADSQDATTIAALATQVFLDTYATEGVRPDLAREAFREYSPEAFAQRLAQPACRFILAERGDGLVGFAELLCTATASPVPEVVGAELVRLYVQPRAQGAGLGRALIGRAEQAAASASLPALWLTVWEGNARARAFYAHLGYVDVGSSIHVIEGQGYGNRVVAKTLGV